MIRQSSAPGGFLCFDSSVDLGEVDKIIEAVDENGEGEIQIDEFCNMMKQLSNGD